MQNDTTTTVHVALDVHKDSIVAAYSVGLGEVQNLGNVGVLERDITKLCTRMQSKGSHVSFVYEAGPTGYGLYRLLTKKGFACMVCAPSLTPRKPGDRVKTDRRDAIKLVKALRMNDLTRVHVPDGSKASGCASGGTVYDTGWIVYTYPAGAASTNKAYVAGTSTLLRATGQQSGVSILSLGSTVISFGLQGQLKPSAPTLSFDTCYRSGSTGAGESTSKAPGVQLNVNGSGNITTAKLGSGASCTPS